MRARGAAKIGLSGLHHRPSLRLGCLFAGASLLALAASCGARGPESSARRVIIDLDPNDRWTTPEGCDARCRPLMRAGETATCSVAAFERDLQTSLGGPDALVCILRRGGP
jgi:hypothetical protein